MLPQEPKTDSTDSHDPLNPDDPYKNSQPISSQPAETEPVVPEFTVQPLAETSNPVAPTPATPVAPVTPVASEVPQPSVPVAPVDVQSVEQQPVAAAPAPEFVPVMSIQPEAQEVVPTNNFAPVPTLGSNDTKKSKKKLFITLGIIVAALLAVFGSSYAVFALWYNNPGKVVSDAAVSLVTSKTVISDGFVTIVSGSAGEQTKAEIRFSSKVNSADVNGEAELKLKFTGVDKKELSVAGSGLLSSSGAFYFKFDNLTELVNKYLDDKQVQEYLASTPQLKADIDAFVKKMDGTWVKVDQEYIKQYAEKFDYDKTKQCFQTAYNELQKNNAQQKQLEDVYDKNQFLILTAQGTETINSTLTNKYSVGIDLSKAYDAEIAYEKTDFAKATDKCSKEMFGDESSDSETPATEKPSDDELRETQQEFDKLKVGLNVSLLDHEFKRVTVNYNDNESKTAVSSQINLTQDAPVNVKDPAKSIPLQEFQADIEKIMSELLGASPAYDDAPEDDATPEVGTTVKERAQDSERMTDLKAIQAQVEAFYAYEGRYPTLNELNSASFRSQYDISIDEAALKDPTGSGTVLVAKTQKGAYAYMPVLENESPCTANGADCWNYELVAILSDGKTEYALGSDF